MEKSLGPASIAKLDPPYLQKASLNPSSLPNPSLNPASLQNPSLPFRRFFATCAPGLEEVVAAELAHPPISASHVELGSSGVAFSGSFLTAYNANLWLRSAVRVLVEIASSPLLHQARSGPRRRDPVYEFVRECADWEEILAIDGDDSGNNGDDDDDYDDGDDDGDDDDDGEMVSHRMHPRSHGKLRMRRSVANDSRRSRSPRMHRRFRTFAVQTRARDCASVNNTMFASIRAKDAICDSIRDSRSGSSKPRPPREGGASADVPLFLSLYRDHASLYRDMSGLSLHRRGYRDAMHRASLNEAIAAGILTIAGWNSRIAGFGEFNAGGLIADVDKMVLLDPMCGSGTFLIEAALMACNRAPGLMRTHWPFQTWHDFDEETWHACRRRAVESIVSPPKGLLLLGNDVHEGAVSLCRKDAKAAGVDHLIHVSCSDCEEFIPATNPGLVVVNPPWGGRLNSHSMEDEPENVLPIWQGLGRFLKKRCNDADVYALSGNPSASRGLHMKSNKKWPITVGGLECKLLHYHVLPPKQNQASSLETVSEARRV